jgi:hypothetical protein
MKNYFSSGVSLYWKYTIVTGKSFEKVGKNRGKYKNEWKIRQMKEDE